MSTQLVQAVKFRLPDNTHVASWGWQDDPPYPPYEHNKNYGVHTGKSGLIVVDADRHDPLVDGVANFAAVCDLHGGIPQTYTQATPRVGFHYVFSSEKSYELGPHRGKHAPWPGVDVLAGGTYFAGAGTYRKDKKVPDGGFYSIAKDLGITEIPEWLYAEIIAQVKLKPSKDTDYPDRGTGSVAYERVIETLIGLGSGYNGTNWQCPAHEDDIPSMSVTDDGDNVLINCFGGCDKEEIMSSVGLPMAALYDKYWEETTHTAFGSKPYTGTSTALAKPSSKILASKDAWEPVDLKAWFSGNRAKVEPTLGFRNDGLPLLYPGRTHTIVAPTVGAHVIPQF